MSQLQQLARCLSASGFAPHPDGKGVYLLYSDSGSLILKHWVGDAFGSEELVATSIRPGSTASYLPIPDGGIVACISDSSTIAIYRYDEDEEDWVEDENVPSCDVHLHGQLAACFLPDGRVCIVFQGSDGQLGCLASDEDDSWNVVDLGDAFNPVAGTPLWNTLDPESMSLGVFYISGADSAVHLLTRAHDEAASIWSDTVISDRVDGGAFKRMFVTIIPDTERFATYAVTDTRSMVQVTGDGGVQELGRVGRDGLFVPSTTAECCVRIFGLELHFHFKVKRVR